MNPNVEPTMTVTAIPEGIRRCNQRRQFRPVQQELDRELTIRLEERSRERARIARELHDTLFQGFFAVSILLQNVMDTLPPHSPETHSLGKTLQVVGRVLEEGRSVLQALRAPGSAPASIEQELSGFLEDLAPSGVRCEVNVTGKPKELPPAIQEQINLIGREAIVNALLHSRATRVEAEVEYLPRRLRVIVRDNGCGIDPHAARTQSNVHWGLVGMRERAESIGAKLTIWSRPGAGTEVEISIPSQTLVEACA